MRDPGNNHSLYLINFIKICDKKNYKYLPNIILYKERLQSTGLCAGLKEIHLHKQQTTRSYPGKMADLPMKRARSEEPLMSAFERTLLFDQIYQGISMDDEFFEKE